MCNVRRTAMAYCAFRIGALLLAPPFLLISSTAFAQSTEASIASATTGSSVTGAVNQNLEELLDFEVHSKPSGSGVAAARAFATGRLQTTDNDGLDVRLVVPSGMPALDGHDGGTTFSYRTNEASAFANGVFTMPGNVLGGELKLGGFVGYDWLSLDLKSNAVQVFDQNQFGSADNGSVIVGGTALWESHGTYVLASIVGTWGETTLTDSVDDCGLAHGCNVNRYKFDTSGFIGKATVGKVFSLSASPSGAMLDLRGSIGYTQNDGDSFVNVNGDEFKVTFSTWTGTLGATLFSNLAVQDNAVLRPYAQAYVRRDWGYENELAFTQSGSGAFTRTAYDQSHLYGGFDTGLTYSSGNVTIGAALYVDGSSDERTLGGRIGVTWKLN